MMKRYFILALFAVAVIGGINVLKSLKTATMSDMVLANVEALAEGETTGMGHYDILEDITNRYFNGELYQQTKVINCHEGGTNACKSGKYYRYEKGDGTWSEWIPA